MAAGAAAMFGSTAHAATITVLPGQLEAVFAKAQPGDVLVLQGTFNFTTLQNRTFSTRVTIDARGASFPQGITIRDSSNLTVLGGTFGNTVAPLASSRAMWLNRTNNVQISGGTFLGWGGSKAGQGIIVDASRNLVIRNSNFSGFRAGFSLYGTRNAVLDRNTFTKQTSDGINIVNSHSVRATNNHCFGFTPEANAHPDCIQLWSLAGQPMQTNISLIGNRAIGAMQGFASFDPSAASGRFLRFENNYVENSYPQGIACYGCFDSVFLGNTLIAMPGAPHKTSLNVIGGARNVIGSNTFIDNRFATTTLSALSASSLSDLGAELSDTGSVWDPRSFGIEDWQIAEAEAFARDGGFALGANSAVPEPAIWAQLMAGFGLVGLARRRRRTRVAA
jgi:hypothetical protein